ncbi:MAG: MerR family transcriptional regulator [Candidatus Zapsychrus exili]|nr:MerR family transcriptional regulator [Candidatus Zapsychrus exili]
MENNKDNQYGTAEVVRQTGITPERLRYWEKLGVVQPIYAQCGCRKFRKYSRNDIHRALVVKTFVDTEKYSLEGAMKKLSEEE